jgi:hypothetical protein
MKGRLHKTENGWEVIVVQATLHGPLLQSLPLFDGDYYEVNRSGQYNHGKEVEFEIVEFPVPPTNGPVSNSISKYAKLVDKETRPLTEEDAWPDYPTLPQQLQIQIAEECFRKYPNNEILYSTDELKDAYKAGVIDGLKEWRLDSYDKPEYPEVKIICPRCKTLMPCSCNSSWDTIMAKSGSWDDSEILAYIIKNYNPPTKKQKDE